MEIISYHSHYAVIDDKGNVLCECDTHKEAQEELEEMEDE